MNQYHTNTNDNLNQLSEKTLIIGIDVSKIEHIARAVDFRGFELTKTFSYNCNMKGFGSLHNWIQGLQKQYQKTDAIVGFEPTGPYGNTLAQYLQNREIRAVLVLGAQVHTAKELDDNSPSKNDFKDALTIAKLISEGRFRKLREFDEPTASLKVAMAQDRQLVKDLTRVKCRIANWLCQYFPEFNIVFKDWTKKTALTTLRNFPMPGDINKLSEADIVKEWRKFEIARGIGIKKATELKFFAMHTAGLTCAHEFADNHIRGMIAQYDALCVQSDELWGMIDILLRDVPFYNALSGIPHIGKKPLCGIIAELGDVNDFSHPRQLIRLAGLSLKACSSGKKRGSSQITKRGRPHLRRALYLAVMNILKAREPTFTTLHRHYTGREDNPLKPMQSVIALCNKLLRIIYGMASTNMAYDPKIVLSGISAIKPTEAP